MIGFEDRLNSPIKVTIYHKKPIITYILLTIVSIFYQKTGKIYSSSNSKASKFFICHICIVETHQDSNQYSVTTYPYIYQL